MLSDQFASPPVSSSNGCEIWNLLGKMYDLVILGVEGGGDGYPVLQIAITAALHSELLARISDVLRESPDADCRRKESDVAPARKASC